MDIIAFTALTLTILIISSVIALTVFVAINYSSISELEETTKNNESNISTNTDLITKNTSSINSATSTLKSISSAVDTKIEYIFDTNAHVLIATTTEEGGKTEVITAKTEVKNKTGETSTKYTTQPCFVFGYIDKTNGKSILSTNYFTTENLCGDETAKESYVVGVETSKYTFVAEKDLMGHIKFISGVEKETPVDEDIVAKEIKNSTLNKEDINEAYVISLTKCSENNLMKFVDTEFTCPKYVVKKSS